LWPGFDFSGEKCFCFFTCSIISLEKSAEIYLWITNWIMGEIWHTGKVFRTKFPSTKPAADPKFDKFLSNRTFYVSW
jgi:hypothetical protein